MSTGRIITFYSYKGGTGRSMALANVAWTLASHNNRVLIVDWDLEAPGLHRYLRPFLVDKELTAPESTGLIDFVRSYATRAATPPTTRGEPVDWYRPFADISKYAIPLRSPAGPPLTFGERGEIRLVPAGRQDDDYATHVNAFAWDRFYSEQNGGAFFNAVRDGMRSYDYVLIDSRTGVSDTSGICTIQMPDVLVVCYTYNVQSIEGASRVARSIRSKRPDLPIFPVAMRAEYQQEPWLKLMREFARTRFRDFVDPKEGDAYFDAIEVPYLSQYAYWERLAAFDDRPGSKSSINTEMARLASHVSGRPMGIVPVDERLKALVPQDPVSFLALDERYTPGEHRVERRRPFAAIWGAIAALLALGLVSNLWQQPAPAVIRARLLVERALDAPVATQVGVLLESGGVPDLPETRQLYSAAFDRVIPAFQYEPSRLLSASWDANGERVATCGVPLMSETTEFNVWTLDGKRAAGPTPLTGETMDCVLLQRENAALILTLDTIALFRWEGTSTSFPKESQRWQLSGGPYTRMAVSSNPSVVLLLGDGQDGAKAVMFHLDVSAKVARILAEAEMPSSATVSILPIAATDAGFAFIMFVDTPKPALRIVRFAYPATPTTRPADPRQLSPGASARAVPPSPPSSQPQVELLPVDSNVGYSYAISSSGRKVAVVSNGQLQVMDIASRRRDSTASLGDGWGGVDLKFEAGDEWIAIADGRHFEIRQTSDPSKVRWRAAIDTSTPLNIDLRGTRVGLTSNSSTLVFKIDSKPPAADAPWPVLVRDLRTYTSLCTNPYERERILFQSPDEALNAYNACETAQGRPPAPATVASSGPPSQPSQPTPSSPTPPTAR